MPVKKTNNNNTNLKKKDYLFAVGKRREAVARVRLYENLKPDLKWGNHPLKKGEILVNEQPISSFFKGDVMRHLYTEPLRIAGAQNKYAFTIKVTGGGPKGQLEAVVGGIAKALSLLDVDTYRKVLKQKGFLTRDDRVKERRKVGTGGKARRKKQSPKR